MTFAVDFVQQIKYFLGKKEEKKTKISYISSLTPSQLYPIT